MKGTLGTNTITQVSFIVRDIEVSKDKFAKFFSVEPPEVIDGGKYEITGTTVMGKPAPDANCLMTFFNAGPNMQIELIQPNGAKSTWQDFLDEHGEGIHHIAFNVKGINEKILACESIGMSCVQRGQYGSGNGEYAYLDATGDLKCIIELLEDF